MSHVRLIAKRNFKNQGFGAGTYSANEIMDKDISNAMKENTLYTPIKLPIAQGEINSFMAENPTLFAGLNLTALNSIKTTFNIIPSIVDAAVKQEQVLDEQTYKNITETPDNLLVSDNIKNQIKTIVNQYNPLIAAKYSEIKAFQTNNPSIYTKVNTTAAIMDLWASYNSIVNAYYSLINERNTLLSQVQGLPLTYSDLITWKKAIDSYHSLELSNYRNIVLERYNAEIASGAVIVKTASPAHITFYPWLPVNVSSLNRYYLDINPDYLSHLKIAEDRRLAKVKEVTDLANDYIARLSNRLVEKALAEAARIRAEQEAQRLAEEAAAIEAAKIEAAKIIAAALAARAAAEAAARAAAEADAARLAAEAEAKAQEEARIAAINAQAAAEALAAKEDAEAEAKRQEAVRASAQAEADRIASEQKTVAVEQVSQLKEIADTQIAIAEQISTPEEKTVYESTITKATEAIQEITNKPITEAAPEIKTATTTTVKKIVSVDKSYLIHPLLALIQKVRQT